MTRRALNALKKSIEHYERMLAGASEKIGPSTCALCAEFNDRPERRYDCIGCPVHVVMGFQYCAYTPYDQLSDHVDLMHVPASPTALSCETCRDLLQAELDFLKSLLPKESK